MAAAEYTVLNGAIAAKLDREWAFERAALPDRLGERRGDLSAARPRPPAFKCLLAGVMASLLYVWPLESLAYIFAGGYSQVIWVGLLVGGIVVGTIATWVFSAREMRFWDENWHTVSDFVPPGPWNVKNDRAN